MQRPKTLKYDDGLNGAMEVVLLRRQYMDGSLAVQMLYDADGYWDFWGDVTVNLCDAANQTEIRSNAATGTRPDGGARVPRYPLPTHTTQRAWGFT